MNRAFTLIELLVAISIMTLMLGIGTIAYRNVARKQSLDQTAAGVVQTLSQAKANALSGKKQGCGAVNLKGWQVRFTAGSYALEETCQTANYIVKTVNYPVAIIGTLPSPNPILFRVLNQGTNIPVLTTITLTNSQLQNKSVTVLSSGEVQ